MSLNLEYLKLVLMVSEINLPDSLLVDFDQGLRLPSEV